MKVFLTATLMAVCGAATAQGVDPKNTVQAIYPDLVRANDTFAQRATVPNPLADNRAMYIVGYVRGSLASLQVSRQEEGADVSCSFVSASAVVAKLILTIDDKPGTRGMEYASVIPVLLQYTYPCLKPAGFKPPL
ncbi:hypothetical protein [Luteibacter sp. dw_328]|uniref:hypothetical protein n=1 Tax=Luteibacter sp. dw_328 TaxID=2719796 RepID=UPI001BD43B15|nr:hypothetical protein [Luteibacter sp. dw_328]